jgi:hypothetical protein
LPALCGSGRRSGERRDGNEGGQQGEYERLHDTALSYRMSSAGWIASEETARTASGRSFSSVTRERERARYSRPGSDGL